MLAPPSPAPPLQVARWLNLGDTDTAPSLDTLRGKVVVMHVFQLGCYGCIACGLPQARALYAASPADEVAVFGLHSVFERHGEQHESALTAFLEREGYRFPVAIDAPDPQHRLPRTLRSYELLGTPSLVIIDRAGAVRMKYFGCPPDAQVAAVIAALRGAP